MQAPELLVLVAEEALSPQAPQMVAQLPEA